MKKKLISILTTIIFILITNSCFAEKPIEVKVNGVPVFFNVSPKIQNGITLVPVKQIFESLEFDVQWDKNTKSIIATNKNTTIKLIVNEKFGYINDKKFDLDVAPTIINGNTLVPLRFIAEGLDKNVNWNSDKRLITIEDKDTITVMINNENLYKAYLHPYNRSDLILVSGDCGSTSGSIDKRYDIYFNILSSVSSHYSSYNYENTGNGTRVKESRCTLYPEKNSIIVQIKEVNYKYTYSLSEDKKTMNIDLDSPNRAEILIKQRAETLNRIACKDMKSLPSINFDEIVRNTYFENDVAKEVYLTSQGKEIKPLKTLYLAKKEDLPLKISENTIITDFRSIYDKTYDPYDYKMFVDFKPLVDTNNTNLKFGFVKDNKLYISSIIHFDIDSPQIKKVKGKYPTFFDDLPMDGGKILKSGEVGTVIAGGLPSGKGTGKWDFRKGDYIMIYDPKDNDSAVLFENPFKNDKK